MNVHFSSEPSRKPSEPTKPVHLGYIDGIRGLAAVYVTLHHFCLWGTNGLPHWARLVFGWTAFGHFSVAVFITLSGFCLMLPVSRSHDQNLRGGFKDYIKRRAWRILPPYYAALVLALIVTAVSPQGFAWIKNGYQSDAGWSSNFAFGNIAAHLLLAHNLSRDWSSKLDMAMWSVATEWQIYFGFGLILLPLWRRFGSAATIAAGFIIGLLPHIFLTPGHNLDWACPWYLGLFSLGMVSATIAQSDRWPQKRVSLLPWCTFFLGLVYLSMKFVDRGAASMTNDPLEWLKDCIAGMIAASVILYCALCSKNGMRPLVISLLQSRAAVGVGTWSYSLYLIHCLVLQEMQTLQHLCHLSEINGLYLRVCIGLPLAFATSYVFFLLFERPFLRERKFGYTRNTYSSKTEEIIHNSNVSSMP